MTHDSTSPTASPEKKALLEAFDTVLKSKADEREAERLAAEARRRGRGTSRFLILVCTTILLFVTVYVFVERPDWIFPSPPPMESLAVRAASLRISVATAAQHVERYRQQNGQLPLTLAQAGAHGGAITYDRLTGGYRLEAENGEVRVTYHSSESLGRFVGNSFKVISRRGK
jgi:hypothetical protein